MNKLLFACAAFFALVSQANAMMNGPDQSEAVEVASLHRLMAMNS